VNGVAQLFRDSVNTVGVQVEQRDDELLAAIPRSHVEGTAGKTLHHLSHPPQCAIACLMAVAVVVGLEVVDIDQQQRQAAMIAHRLLPHPREVLLESTSVLQTGESIARGHLSHERALQKRRTQLPLDTAVNEGPDGTGQAKYAHVVGNGGGWLPHVSQCRAMRQDHQSDRDQGFPEQLPAQEVKNDAVGSEQVELVGMAVDDPSGHSYSRCDGEYGQRHARGTQVETLVITAPGGPYEEQACRQY